MKWYYFYLIFKKHTSYSLGRVQHNYLIRILADDEAKAWEMAEKTKQRLLSEDDEFQTLEICQKDRVADLEFTVVDPVESSELYRKYRERWRQLQHEILDLEQSMGWIEEGIGRHANGKTYRDFAGVLWRFDEEDGRGICEDAFFDVEPVENPQV